MPDAGLGLLLIATGIVLFVRPLPAIHHAPRPRRFDRAEFLEMVIDEQRAGRTPFGAVAHALAAFDRPIPSGPDAVAASISKELPEYARLWELLHQRGSGLLEAAENLREGLRQRERLEQEIQVRLAGTRATIRLLLVLPWAYLVLAQLAGLKSLSILISHVWGWALIAVSAGLTWLGTRWIRRIMDRALA